MTQAAEKAGKKAIMQRRLCACRLATFLTILILGALLVPLGAYLMRET